MKPSQPLPIRSTWTGPEDYVDSLLDFVSTSTLFQNLCGGVHILDFLTREPGLYDAVLPEEWRLWFDSVRLEDVLDLLLRENLHVFDGDCETGRWRGYEWPPVSLIEYVWTIRRHSLKRDMVPRPRAEALPRHIAVGMKPKKIHEVTQFAAFVDDLSATITVTRQDQATNSEEAKISRDLENDHGDHSNPTVIDFGSGQNYLGRTLACRPYNKHVIAIEQRHHNVEGARGMDVHAKLAKKEKTIINKKNWKKEWMERKSLRNGNGVTPYSRDSSLDRQDIPDIDWTAIEDRVPFKTPRQQDAASFLRSVQADLQVSQLMAGTKTPDVEPVSDGALTPATPGVLGDHPSFQNEPDNVTIPSSKIRYVEKELSNGSLSDVISSNWDASVVVSIHSCGNLTHHGLRSLTLNPSVKAVAMIGCCYNLLTERLGPPTYKLPTLRSNHPRLEETGGAYDVHGFPMSKKLEQHEYQVYTDHKQTVAKGIRMNITARMMAVQAPHNWGPKDSEEFFTKHFYRALLQRILLDLDIVKMSKPESTPDIQIAGGSISGKDDTGGPLIIGSLRKSCFQSFRAYVEGAIEKLCKDSNDGAEIRKKTRSLFEDDGKPIMEYEKKYAYAKKQLSIIWSLMAFSANVVESTIIVDRWLWLKEQEEVVDAWVEAVFDYKQSPRNMVVVGIKKPEF